MSASKLSRRRLLGGLLAAVGACLWPRSSRANAPPRQPKPPAAPQPGGLLHSTTSSYDHMNRLISVTEHVSQANEPPRPIRVTRNNQVTTYTY